MRLVTYRKGSAKPRVGTRVGGAYSLYVERAAKGATEADGLLSAAC